MRSWSQESRKGDRMKGEGAGGGKEKKDSEKGGKKPRQGKLRVQEKKSKKVEET